MSAANGINLRSAPMSKDILVAKSYRLARRRRECMVVTGAIASIFVIALRWSLIAQDQGSIHIADTTTFVLALLLGVAVQVLWLNREAQVGLTPATAAQLEIIGAARAYSVVNAYVAAVHKQGRILNQSEAWSIIDFRNRAEQDGQL